MATYLIEEGDDINLKNNKEEDVNLINDDEAKDDSREVTVVVAGTPTVFAPVTTTTIVTVTSLPRCGCFRGYGHIKMRLIYYKAIMMTRGMMSSSSS
ncbi:hypothetical protein CTI12_AA127520 [Artemisia annua]|uniref:Uncharacterized protein n=1 Tax=Artemisia annua TaxID=35608 RepID=A0A2U1PPR3_ARTAN|nr:hypothetical protein CTI12_AA127520 [Artemisia annua]